MASNVLLLQMKTKQKIRNNTNRINSLPTTTVSCKAGGDKPYYTVVRTIYFKRRYRFRRVIPADRCIMIY
jgi:hypothetical protein